MKRATLIALTLLLSAPAIAQPPPPPPRESRVELAARLGFGLPFGKISADSGPVSDNATGQVAIWLEGFYRITPTILIGGYLSYGFILAKDCPEDVDCSGSDFRIGPQVRFDLTQGKSFTPWVALGVGYESITVAASTGGVTFSVDANGWEFLNAQFGADFRVGPRFAIGPFVSFSVDETTSIADEESFDKSLHEWLLIGARGAFDL